jgi:hypothetical protein
MRFSICLLELFAKTNVKAADDEERHHDSNENQIIHMPATWSKTRRAGNQKAGPECKKIVNSDAIRRIASTI